MSTVAFDPLALTRIADFARTLTRLHKTARRRAVDDDQIDRAFNAVCMSVWGYTIDDISDDLFSCRWSRLSRDPWLSVRKVECTMVSVLYPARCVYLRKTGFP